MMFTLEDFKTSDGLIVMTEDAARILLYSERKNKSLGVVHRDEIMAELKMKKTREFSDLISDKKNCLLEKSILPFRYTESSWEKEKQRHANLKIHSLILYPTGR